MEKNEGFVIRRMKNKARKHGLPTEYSHYFDELAQNKKDYYKEIISEFSIGQPVLLFETMDKKWTILGTQKVISYDGSLIRSVSLINIEKVTSGALDRCIKSGQSKLEAFKRNKLSKGEMADVAVYDLEGNVYYLYAYKGADLFSLWNILLLAVQLNI